MNEDICLRKLPD